MDPKLITEDKSKVEGVIRTMPSKYLPTKKTKGSSGKYLVITVIVVLILVIIALGILFFSSVNSTPQATEDLASQVTTPTIDQDVQEEGQQEPEEVIPSVEEVPAVIKIAIPAINLRTSVPGVDTDQDGLSDIEEAIFITSNAVPDTDEDSFLDGVEVGNLYDPASPSALLDVSPQIKIARNLGQNYQLLIPSKWTATQNNPKGEELMIRPDMSDDLFVINVYNNPDRLQVTEWYRDQVELPDLAGFQNFSNPAGWTGIQSRDNLVVIATFGEEGPGARAFIYVMEYRLGLDSTINYPAIWSMILNSLDILDPSEE